MDENVSTEETIQFIQVEKYRYRAMFTIKLC